MGWTYTNKPAKESSKSFFSRELGGVNASGTSFRVLDTATHGNEVYVALERIRGDERIVYAVVCLIDRTKKDYNFGYKDISEDMGPYYFNCPSRILNLLTPTTNPHALEWRAKCLAQAERKAQLKGLKYGDKIVFGRPLKFLGFGEEQIFKVVDTVKRTFFSERLNAIVSIQKRTLEEDAWTILSGGVA